MPRKKATAVPVKTSDFGAHAVVRAKDGVTYSRIVSSDNVTRLYPWVNSKGAFYSDREVLAGGYETIFDGIKEEV